jgi:hypothetical protein
MWRRRLQQRRCLVCGARQLVNQQTSYFCASHIATHRYCTLCETLRSAEEHGRDSRCRACATNRALMAYHADPDRTLYRIRLKQMAQRKATRGDQLFASVRRRIALADLVRATPGMSWPQRAAIVLGNPTWLADAWRKQVRGDVRDPDMADRAKQRRNE